MSFEFVNRICPYCKNPNYMIDISDVSKIYKYRCMNCFNYFNDNDFEPLQPTLKTKCMNKKIDIVEVVRCKDCKHRPKEPNLETYESGLDLEFPEGSKCPCRCGDDEWYSWYPEDNWFCANGERKEG